MTVFNHIADKTERDFLNREALRVREEVAHEMLVSAANTAAIIDKNVAAIFLEQPFNRNTITEAFRMSLKKCAYAHLADDICEKMLNAANYAKKLY